MMFQATAEYASFAIHGFTLLSTTRKIVFSSPIRYKLAFYVPFYFQRATDGFHMLIMFLSVDLPTKPNTRKSSFISRRRAGKPERKWNWEAGGMGQDL